MEAYREEVRGEFVVRWFYDEDSTPPWKKQDMLSWVSDWTQNRKGAGERILCKDRRSFLFYDFKCAVKKARSGGMKGEDAVKAVEFEFNWLRRWCDDKWFYCGIEVSKGEDGIEVSEVGGCASLWGVESDASEDYFEDIIRDLMREVE